MYLKKVGLLLSSIVLVTKAELHKYEFNITSGVINPDCSEKGVLVPHINGQFPGPSIHVQVGDEVEIMVRNQIEQFNTSIHYHGIRQIGSTDADGVPGVTQYPINPGNSYTQRFKVSQQAGTYFYHAHVGLQDDSVQGSFIVYESDTANPKKVAKGDLLQAGPYQYKKDLVLQLSEWWHEDLDSRQAYYTSNSFTFDHGSDSILINGRTVYNPTANSDKSCQGYTTFDVEPNTTYRLRVIGANSFRTLALAIKQHNLTMIEVDGELIHPYQTSFLEITPGQRFSVLLKTGDHPVGSTFAIGTSYLWRQRGRGVTENGFGYIRYVNPTVSTNENGTSLFKPIMKWSNRKNPFDTRAEHGDIGEIEHDRGDKKGSGRPGSEGGGRPGSEGGGRPGSEGSGRPGNKGGGRANGEGGDHEGGGREGGGREGGGRESGGRESGGREGGGREGGGREGGGREGGGREGGGGGNGGRAGGGGGGGGGGRPGGGGGGGGGRPAKKEKHYVDLPLFPKMDEPDWLWHNLKPLADRDPILDETDVRTIHLHTSTKKMPDNTTRYLINQRHIAMSSTPLVESFSSLQNQTYTETSEQYNDALGTYRLSHNEVVDLVFQNTKNAIGGCLLHPWHTHGHSHYVIASGAGSYDHALDKDIRNFENPLFKDTTVVYPSVPTEDTDGCGWTKVRLLADNPGFWAVHCHITTHMLQGKMIILEEEPELMLKYNLYPRL